MSEQDNQEIQKSIAMYTLTETYISLKSRQFMDGHYFGMLRAFKSLGLLDAYHLEQYNRLKSLYEKGE